MKKIREYTKPISKYGTKLYIIEFNELVENGWITDDDGFGYWVKNNLACDDEVFSSSQQDATHVVWYNK